ncbi:hypothetical protein KM043_005349 [Ampulex compressa]|nr:hypothetical protein KM043_005349 [Ampulex compressa]
MPVPVIERPKLVAPREGKRGREWAMEGDVGPTKGYRGEGRPACLTVHGSARPCISVRVVGMQPGCEGGCGSRRRAGVRWEARGWHSVVSPVCAYMPSCVIDSWPGALLPPYLRSCQTV